VVTDNGPGIPPEIQIRLFEQFVTYGKSDGTGLGLAIVRQIIESHDGILTVESSPAGASFKRVPDPVQARHQGERLLVQVKQLNPRANSRCTAQENCLPTRKMSSMEANSGFNFGSGPVLRASARLDSF
jgi:hypothetical protein